MVIETNCLRVVQDVNSGDEDLSRSDSIVEDTQVSIKNKPQIVKFLLLT